MSHINTSTQSTMHLNTSAQSSNQFSASTQTFLQRLKQNLNDAYEPYLGNASRYLHLWGGAGAGKSVFAAQKILYRLLTEPGPADVPPACGAAEHLPHRILCVRKVAKTLRSSVYQLLRDQIRALGLRDDFKIHKSEMRFTHSNGNELLLVGLDDPDKLKSIAGITSVWIEEATDLTTGDFDQLDLRLRGITSHYKQIILSYNPVDERHWLKTRFHDNLPTGEAGESAAVESTLVHTTFLHNRFIDDEYRRVLERKALVNANLYRIYYLGEWGKEEVQRAYVYNFDKGKTICHQVAFQPQLPVYFSFDFNVEPFICLCSHIWNDNNGMHYHIFKELVIERNGDIYRMADMIAGTFPTETVVSAIFTGDAMERKRQLSQRNNIHAWTILQQQLHVNARRIQVPSSNPPVRENRYLVNAICAFHPDFKIHPDCGKLIYDLQYVETDEDGNILKQNRSRQSQRADALDAFRYQCNTHLSDFYRYKIKRGNT